MIDYRGDSDVESSGEILNSSQGSMSSRSSFGRLSFDAAGSPKTQITPRRASNEATLSASRPKGAMGIGDFRLVQVIGAGDIGRVYLCRLRRAGEEMYAMKVVDKEAVALKKKSQRAEIEKRILKMVDHPFLPRLHALFEDSRFSCIVMEFCPGGDLHSLRHKQPQKRFPLSSARFYAAEVLVALEYLHMLGIIYRDLKPENVLVRSDGHIMLSDFDLSLCSGDTTPSLLHSPAPAARRRRLLARLSCFPGRPFGSRKIRTPADRRQFVAEPVDARSGSFVGTHEYVAPEIASGRAHGSAVDWWAMGIFIYEMIYGRTPFSGGGSNEATLRSIVEEPLAFPTEVAADGREAHARSLISGLLAKDPNGRLGSKRGAAEVKSHPFFAPLNLALIRSVTPPVLPGAGGQKTTSLNRRRSRSYSSKSSKTTTFDYF